MSKQVQGYSCNICGKYSGDLTKAKAHMEAKHFPSSTGYTCQCCNRWFKTKNALNIHMSREHRDIRVWTVLSLTNWTFSYRNIDWTISCRQTELSWRPAELLWKGGGWDGPLDLQPVLPIYSPKSAERAKSCWESALPKCFSIFVPLLWQGLLYYEGNGSA